MDKKPESVEENIGAMFFAAVFFCLPSVFFWQVPGGAGTGIWEFFENYLAFTATSLKLAALASATTAVCVGMYRVTKRYAPKLFESPPKNPDGGSWTGVVAAVTAIPVAIASGYFFGASNGMLTFWPATMALYIVFSAVYWVHHQLKRWWQMFIDR